MFHYFGLPQIRASNAVSNDRNNCSRKLVAFISPLLIVHTLWWSYMTMQHKWNVFSEQIGSAGSPLWILSLTMMLGSFVAGATSEGGAAVAFPVMTLVLGVAPVTARDFSFLIQSVGMTSAAFSIWYMEIAIDYGAVQYCTAGGMVGVMTGLYFVSPLLSPAFSKMYFVSIWSAFALALFLVNRNSSRAVYLAATGGTLGLRKEVILVTCGFIGGIFSSIGGSGLDMCAFSVLTLLFNVTERVATPTSVVLMAINTVVAFLFRRFVMNGVDPVVYDMWLVCIPVVVIGAPLGAIISSHCHRQVLAAAIYVLDTVQLIGALVVIQPWSCTHTESPLLLSLSSLAVWISAAAFFCLLSHIGGQHRQLREVPTSVIPQVLNEYEMVTCHPLHQQSTESKLVEQVL